MKRNKEFKVWMVRNLMQTNYNLSGYEIDLEAEIDNSISACENWYKLKKTILHLCKKEHKTLFM